MIDAIIEISNDTNKTILSAFPHYSVPPVSVNVASDTIILSSTYNSQPISQQEYWSVFTPILQLFLVSSLVELEYIKRGFLIKGGISLGQFYRSEYIVFGEALAKSATLEKNHSEPNIVVEESLINTFIEAAYKVGFPLNDIQLGRTFVHTMNNTYTFLHYMLMACYCKQFCNPDYKSDGSDTIEEHKNGLIKAIHRGLNTMTGSIALKYLWAIEYHNDTNKTSD